MFSRSPRRTLPRGSWPERGSEPSRLERLRVRERRVEAALELEQARFENGAFRLAVRRELVESLAQLVLRRREALLELERDLVAPRGDRRVRARRAAARASGPRRRPTLARRSFIRLFACWMNDSTARSSSRESRFADSSRERLIASWNCSAAASTCCAVVRSTTRSSRSTSRRSTSVNVDWMLCIASLCSRSSASRSSRSRRRRRSVSSFSAWRRSTACVSRSARPASIDCSAARATSSRSFTSAARCTSLSDSRRSASAASRSSASSIRRRCRPARRCSWSKRFACARSRSSLQSASRCSTRRCVSASASLSSRADARSCSAIALRRESAMLPLLARDERQRLGARAREHALELRRALVGALRHLRGEARLRAGDLAFDLARVEDAAADADRSDRDDEAHGQPRRRVREVCARVEREEDPCGGRDRTEAGDDPVEHSLRGALERRADARRPPPGRPRARTRSASRPPRARGPS